MTRPGFLRDTRAASGAEFALVLPIMLLFLFGIIDVGTYAWRVNEAEKAAQMGLRYAVVTNAVASGLTASTNTYVGSTACGGTLTAGDTICAAALGKMSCGDSGTCTCTTAPCPPLTRDAAAFTNVANRVRAVAPWIPTTDIKVEYSGSGLGYAGDPRISLSPVVSVKLVNLSIRPISGFLFKGTVGLPTINRSLTMEDGQGSKAN